MNGATVKAYSKAKDGNTSLTAHFKVREFACKDGSDVIFISDSLVSVLQQIRYHFGKPVTINSGYRTPPHNKKEGGATYSRHLYGVAADIVVKDTEPILVAQYADELLGKTGCVGLYKGYIHLDVRPTKYLYDKRSGKEVAVSAFK